MRQRGGQGEGPSTLDKERQLSAMFDMQLHIVLRTCPSSTYRHIDLNAGSGWNQMFDVPGSPLVFVELADRILGDRWQALFFERDPLLMADLKVRLGNHPRCLFFETDNANFLEISRRYITVYDVGSVLADPNGWLYRAQTGKLKGEGAPVRQMLDFFNRHRRMDLMVNLNAQTYIKMRGARDNHRHHPNYKDFHALAEFPSLFNKQYGLISTLSSNGHSRFLRAIYRNFRSNDYRAWGWYHLNSPEASEVYQQLEGSGQTEPPPQLAFVTP